MFDNLFMLSNENGNTNTLAGSYYVDLIKKNTNKKPISFKFADQGRKVMGTFRCLQTKPEINILFAVCRVLNSCGRAICIFRDQLGKSGTRIRYQNFNGIAWVLYFDFLDDFWPAYSIGP